MYLINNFTGSELPVASYRKAYTVHADIITLGVALGAIDDFLVPLVVEITAFGLAQQLASVSIVKHTQFSIGMHPQPIFREQCRELAVTITLIHVSPDVAPEVQQTPA